jgi:hypothetical protein
MIPSLRCFDSTLGLDVIRSGLQMIDLVHDTTEAELVLKCVCKYVWGFELLFIHFEGTLLFFLAHEAFPELS